MNFDGPRVRQQFLLKDRERSKSQCPSGQFPKASLAEQCINVLYRIPVLARARSSPDVGLLQHFGNSPPHRPQSWEAERIKYLIKTPAIGGRYNDVAAGPDDAMQFCQRLPRLFQPGKHAYGERECEVPGREA